MTRPREADHPARYELHFEHVTTDGAVVRPDLERETRTGLPEADVLAVLERFAAIDAMQTVEVEPQITVRAPQLLLQVRPYRGRLLACDPGTAERVWRELTLDELAHALHATASSIPPTSPAPLGPDHELAAPARRTRRWPHLLLLVGLALNAYAIATLFIVRPAPDFVPAEGGRLPREIANRMTGSYAATPPGHVRQIELRPPNIVVFRGSEGASDRTDTYLFGSYKDRPRLLTGSHGFIDLLEAHDIEFEGRRYVRATGER